MASWSGASVRASLRVSCRNVRGSYRLGRKASSTSSLLGARNPKSRREDLTWGVRRLECALQKATRITRRVSGRRVNPACRTFLVSMINGSGKMGSTDPLNQTPRCWMRTCPVLSMIQRPSPETWGVRARIRVGKGALRKSLWGLSRVPSRTSKVLKRKLGGHTRATKLARVLQVEGIWVVADRVRVELRGLHSGHSIMKLAWCPESGPANWAENLNKNLLNGQRCLCPAPPK